MIVLLAIALSLGGRMFAQKQTKDNFRYRSAQITLFSPLGTNAFKSGRTINHFSVNILAGYSAGVKGLEVGGLINVVRRDVFGIQLAGLGNSAGWSLTGVQAAGLYNLARHSSEGGQFAGLINVIGGGAYSVQGAGLANIVARNQRGLQAAGLINLTGYTMTGAQFAGLVNIAGREVRGIQLSALVNYTKRLNGIQIGLINIADTVERGVAIGFLSFSKNGYHKWELGANESLSTTLGFKTGSQHFYNIFSVGVRWQEAPLVWAVGYGLGTEWNLGQKATLNLDAMAWYLNEGEAWTDELNLLNKLQLNLGWRLSERMTLFGGASLNVRIREQGGQSSFDFSFPGNLFEFSDGDIFTNVYPGFQVGIRI